MFNIQYYDDWSQTADLRYQKRPLYQLSHNYFPHLFTFAFIIGGITHLHPNGFPITV